MKMMIVKQYATEKDFANIRRQTAITKARFERKLKASVAKVETDLTIIEEEKDMNTVCGDFNETLIK